MLPALDSTESKLAIWEEDGRMTKLPLLVLENITPGMARNATFAASITVDWGT